MTSIRLTRTLFASALLLGLPGLACAQAAAQGSAQASGGGDIELGATQASSVEMSANHSHSTPATHSGSGELRLALQGRLNALNMLNFARPAPQEPGSGEWQLSVPVVTPGVRLIDQKLFLGLGLGLAGSSASNDNAGDTSRSGWSLSPLATFDIVRDTAAALSLIGWFNFARLSNTEACGPNGNCVSTNDHWFGWGAALGLGVRGFVSQGLALGGEFGWSFLSYSAGSAAPADSAFTHGLFGNIFVEGSVGI